MTDLLYQIDSYARDATATVTAHGEGDAPATGATGTTAITGIIVFDRTILYPGGGGQPFDTGQLTWNGGVARVIRGAKVGVDALSMLEGDVPPVGTAVEMSVDWDRRYRLMRTHTAMHCLCGVVFRDFGALVTGGQMDLDRSRMDFELDDLSPGRVAAIEREVNAAITADLPVRVRILPREEALAIPDLIRTKINLLPTGIAEIRTVEIVGLDLQADGGTHVARTSEVVGIRVVGTRSKGKNNKRLEIELMERAE